jgi:hypothetical protein
MKQIWSDFLNARYFLVCAFGGDLTAANREIV